MRGIVRSICRDQAGFTLIETVVGVAIGGLIIGGIVAATVHTLSASARAVTGMGAVIAVESAVHWISRDAYRADTLQATSDADGLPLTLIWTATDGVEHQAVYTLTAGSLIREHYSDRATNPSPDVTTTVAKGIVEDPSATNCAFANGVLTVTVTASSVQGAQSASETRTWQVLSRAYRP